MKLYSKSNVFIALLFTILLISLGVITIINFKPLYYYDIKALNLEKETGLSNDEIRSNYDTLIHYCSPFNQEDLEFPTLTSSKEGLIHFEEVKRIFVAFYYMAAISFLLLLLPVIKKWKNRDFSFLRTSSYLSILLPVIVGIACSLNFDKSFELFHKLFFRNDYWIFDPAKDPIINLLPEAFFLHCAIFIILFVLIGSALLFALSKILGKQGNSEA
ncbi:integral membrane protein [Lachnospiraceae bacterium KM106-2]|nr:integral membrane protein [Lachnospiraceae bacterium KM106-2]